MFSYSLKKPLFPLGRILIAPIIKSIGIDVQRLLRRHQSGDFGCVNKFNDEHNYLAIKSGEGILSLYDIMVGNNTNLICVVTEANCSYTVVFILDKSQIDLCDLLKGERKMDSDHP